MSAIYARYGVDSFSELLVAAARRVWPREGLMTLTLLVFLLLSVVWSVEAAGWVDQLPSLTGVALGAAAMGFVFAKTRLPGFLTHPVALLYGAVITVWQTTTLINRPELSDQIVDLVIRLNAWGYAARTGGVNTDTLVFVFWVVALTWIIGYVSTWIVFRHHRVWLGIVPGAVAILMNLRFAPPHATVWFFFFLIFALLLIVRFHIFQQQIRWRRERVDASTSSPAASLPEVTFYSLLIVAFVWFAPSGGPTPIISDIWNTVTGPYNDFAVEFNRLFANLNTQNEGPATTFSRSLVLRGPINLSSSVIMFVQADSPVYLRATTYDIYNGKGFVTGEKVTVNFPVSQEGGPAPRQYRSRQEQTQRITLRATPGNAILAAGIPLRGSQRAVGEVDRPLSYYLNLDDSANDSALPSSMRAAAPAIRETFIRLRADNLLGAVPSDAPAELARAALPPDVRVASYLLRDGRVTSLELQYINPFATDITSIRVPGRGRAPNQYTVVSSLSNASEQELRQAATQYPGWIAERYLQLPPNTSERVRRLARQIVGDATNPYDQAVRIQDYLRTFRYNERIEAPPPNADPLEHFLFTVREGYCDYFASSMAVMLRSLGVPTRIAAGYFTGEFDPNRGHYLVRESNTHAWPEVYFPDYGWIEFEPTPSRPTIARGDGAPDGASTASGGAFVTGDGALDDPLLLEEDFGFGFASTEEVQEPFPVGPTILLTMIALAVGGGWYFWTRGLSGMALPLQVYTKVGRLAAIGFRPQRPAETPIEYGVALGRVLPERRRTITTFMHDFTAAQYSKSGANLSEVLRLRRAWDELRGALLALALKRPLRMIFGPRERSARRAKR